MKTCTAEKITAACQIWSSPEPETTVNVDLMFPQLSGSQDGEAHLLYCSVSPVVTSYYYRFTWRVTGSALSKRGNKITYNAAIQVRVSPFRGEP